MMKKSIVEKLVDAQKKKLLYPFAHALLAIFGVEIPRNVVLGEGVRFAHRSPGLVIHPMTRVGNNVHFYQGVTLGLAYPWKSIDSFEGGECFIDVKDDVILCAGCKVLSKGKLVIGKGTIIGANAVLTQSTGENEIWAGIPAKLIGKR
jgi:serine O-acetyltransferase